MTQNQIYKLMKEYSLTAGIILMKYRGKVKNKGKKSKDLINDEYAADGIAKTEVDELVQELFLEKLLKIAPEVRINVEEDTPNKYLFAGNNSKITIHQDPCDGTNSYIHGLDEFATGYAISNEKNEFTHTVIFSPARKRLYVASPFECKVFDETLKEIQTNTEKKSNIIFEKRMLSKNGKDAMQKAGFALGDFGCSHLGIVDVALENSCAFLYGRSNPHDSFIPYAFANKQGAKLLNAKGQTLTGKNILVEEDQGFLKFKRLNAVCYFSSSNNRVDEIMEILSHKENLHPQYLETQE